MFIFLTNLLRAFRGTLRSLWAKIKGPDAKVPLFAHPYPRSERTSELQARVYFGRQNFNRFLTVVSSAQKTIDLQTFIWRSDDVGRQVAELLVKAADRGVHVTVRKEVTGDIFELNIDFAGTSMSPDPVWSKFWHHPLIEVRHENAHDHSKVCIVDDQVMLVASMNIGSQDCLQWHECLVEVEGAEPIAAYRRGETKLPTLTKSGQVGVLHSSSTNPMMPAVLELLQSAKKSIRIEMAYFSDPTIIELLAKKSHDGVFVLVILPHSSDIHHHANIAAATTLLHTGRKNRTFVFRYPKKFLHTKMIIIDRKTLFIGSTNLITSSLTAMGETSVLIHRRPKRCLQVARRRFLKDSLSSSMMRPSHTALSLLWHSLLSAMNL